MVDIDEAEHILRTNQCRIQSFLVKGHTQYVVKHQHRNVSISFDSITDLCRWVLSRVDDLERNIDDDQT